MAKKSFLLPMYNNVTEKFNSQTLLWFLVHFLSSMGLTLCNKYVASSFKFPLVVLMIQNSTTLVLTFVFGALIPVIPLKPFKLEHLYYTFPVTVFYIFLLWSSLEALGRISVPMMVVGRSISPILTMVGESVLFGVPFSSNSASAIVLLFTGSVVFALNDYSVTATSFKWLAINVALSGFVMPLIEKKLVKNMTDQTPAGINCYRNLISLPLLGLMAYIRQDLNEHTWSTLLEMEYPLVFVVSCFLGFSISLAYFFLQSLVPATSIVVAQVFYKLATVVVGLLVFPTIVYWKAWYGLVISFLGISMYTFTQLQPSLAARFSKGSLSCALFIVMVSLVLILSTPRVFVTEIGDSGVVAPGGSWSRYPLMDREVASLQESLQKINKIEELQTYDFMVMVEMTEAMERGNRQFQSQLEQVREDLFALFEKDNSTQGPELSQSNEAILKRFLEVTSAPEALTSQPEASPSMTQPSSTPPSRHSSDLKVKERDSNGLKKRKQSGGD